MRRRSAFWVGGLAFSLPVLGILGAHELGHYLACRYYDVDATLPWFLPAPLPLTGTLGAFIRLREPIPNARALFDIAVAGPLAGFVVAVPLLVAGIAASKVIPLPGDGGGLVLGDPLLFTLIERLHWGAIPDGDALYVHPMGLAAWFGLLATALNLFPFGQLDGGHITYALFGRRARWLSAATIVGTVALAIGSLSWAAWAVLMVGMTAVHGIGHPPTGDDAPAARPRPRRPRGRRGAGLRAVLHAASDRTDGRTGAQDSRPGNRARTRATLIVVSAPTWSAHPSP